MQIEINNDLGILDQLAKTWLVNFNPKKTKALIISNNSNIPEFNTHPTLRMHILVQV
jgi:hypothetical protein